MSVLDDVLGLSKKAADIVKQAILPGVVPAAAAYQSLKKIAKSPTTQKIINTPINYNPNSAGGKALYLLSKATNNPVTRKVDLASEGFVAGSTGNLINPTFVKGTRTKADRFVRGTGTFAGVVNPYSPVGKVMTVTGRAGSAGTKALLTKAAPKIASKAITKVAPAVGSEVAQTAAYTAGQAATGQPITPGSNLAWGLAGRGGMSGGGQALKRVLGNAAKAFDPEDVASFDWAVDTIRNKKSTPQLRQKAIDVIDKLSEGYANKADIDRVKGNTEGLIRLLRKQIGDASGQKGPVPGLGLVEQRKTQTLNTERLQLSKKGKQHLASLEPTTPKTTLKNEQVIRMTDEVKGKDQVISQAQTATDLARRLANRQKVVTLETQYQNLKKANADPKELEDLTAQIARASKVARSEATDAGRTLQAQTILADQMASPMQRVFKLLDNAGVDPEKYGREAAKVNWDDANSVVQFYRKYVPPKFGEWIDEYRYTNMLSSPKSWITNIASNVVQTGVQPVRKVMAGGFDWAISHLTGRERQHFVRETTPFVRNALASLPDAFTEARNALTGKQAITNLDLDRLPTGNKVMSAYAFPMRIMEAGDMFFKKILQSGEQGALEYRAKRLGKNLEADVLTKQAKDYALETVFRGELNKQGQGWILDSIDGMTSLIQQARNIKGVGRVARLVIPFIQTPMNILKQGVEYSPLGFVNMVKSKGDVADQLAKATIGSMVMTGAGMIAATGNSTWEAPTNAKERAEFYAAGKQPYSLRIGGKWVSYSKLGPLAYPIAMAAAMHEAVKSREEDEMALVTAGHMIAMVGGFFTDQSYMQSLGDIIDAARGDEFKQTRMLTSIPQQFVPLRALQGWITRMVDPVYRQVDWKDGIPQAIAQSIQAQTPFLSKELPAYETPFGEESKRQYPIINSVLPFTISKENPVEAQYYEQQNAKRAETRQENKLKKQFEDETTKGTASGLPTDKRMQMADVVFKLKDIKAMPEGSEYEKTLKQGKVFGKVDDVLDSEDFTEDEKTRIIESLGVSRDDADYYEVARQTEAAKSAFVQEAIGRAQGNGIDPWQLLTQQRREVNGKVILSNGVIDELEDTGILTDSQAKELKKYRFDKASQSVTKKSGSGGSDKKYATKANLTKLTSATKLKPLSQLAPARPASKRPLRLPARRKAYSRSLDSLVFGK